LDRAQVRHHRQAAAEAEPRHGSAGPHGGRATHAAQVTRAAVLVAAALGLAAPAAADARTPDCPAAVGAPSAIVIEVSSGTAACARAPERERPVGSTTK